MRSLPPLLSFISACLKGFFFYCNIIRDVFTWCAAHKVVSAFCYIQMPTITLQHEGFSMVHFQDVCYPLSIALSIILEKSTKWF